MKANKRCLTNLQSSRQVKSKTQLTVSSEGKQETTVGSEQNRSKIAKKKRKNGSDRSSMKYCSERTSRRKHGDRFGFWYATKKTTEKMLVIICQFARYQCCKLFATAMCARPPPSLHKVQPPDHRFLRLNHQTDHLMVYNL